MTNMELDDELKLRVAIRLIDKSAATWWDNLKLHSTPPVTWIKKGKNFSNLSSVGGL